MSDIVISSGATSSSLTVGSGDTLTVLAGGTVQSATILAGATLDVSPGGVVQSLTVGSGETASGVEVGYLTVLPGGSATSVTVEPARWPLPNVVAGVVDHMSWLGAEVILSGSDSYSTIGPDGLLDSGSVLSDAIDSGGEIVVVSGGLATGEVVGAGAELTLSGGEAVATTVSSQGVLSVSSGAVVSGVTVLGGGLIDIQSGAQLQATTVASGGQLQLLGLQVGSAQTLSFSLQPQSAGLFSGIRFASGAQLIAVAPVVSSGGVLELDAGAVAYSATVLAGGVISGGGVLAGESTVASGGSVVGVTVDAAVSKPLPVNSNAISSGGGEADLVVDPGGFASAIIVQDAGLYVETSGTVDDVVVQSGGLIAVTSGAVASGVTVDSGGVVDVEPGTDISGLGLMSGAVIAFGEVTVSDITVTSASASVLWNGGYDLVLTSGGAIVASTPITSGLDLTYAVVSSGQGNFEVQVGGAASGSLAWEASLPAGSIRTDLLATTQDGNLDAAAATQLLDDLASAGPVTASEFSQLQTLASHLDDPGFASPWLASVLGQLIDGSPQNATWTGGASTTTPLGNLQVGTTPAQLDQLIGQWLLGTNLPDPTVPADPGAVDTQVTVSGYQPVATSLYDGAGPLMEDICQGEIGDCVFMAGLVEMAVNHPAMLDSMIVNEGPGLWGVEFFVNGQPTWETVNAELPVDAQNDLVYAANPGDQEGANWVPLIEKAYVQLAASGEVGLPAVNSYANINGDPVINVLQNLSDATQVNGYLSDDNNMTALQSLFIADIAAGDDVMLEDFETATTDPLNGLDQLVPDHAFGIIGYDSATGGFIVRNPWGDAAYDHPYWDAQFEIPMAEIADDDLLVVVDNTGSTVAARALISSDIFADGESDVLIENTSGAVVVGEAGPNGQLAYYAIGGLGPEWRFEGAGDFQVGYGDAFVIENTAGAVVLGSVVVDSETSAHAVYSQVGGLGPEWKFVETGDFLGLGLDQVLIENAAGAVVEGQIGSTGQLAYTQVTALGPEWKFAGSGDYLGDGRSQFLIENTAGAVVLGEVGSGGQSAYTALTGLGPEWTFEGSGDLLGDGKDQFLIENTTGVVVVGEVTSANQVAFTQVAALGREWKFVGVGQYDGQSQAQFLIENTAGAIVTGTIVSGQAQYASVAGLGPEWSFRG